MDAQCAADSKHAVHRLHEIRKTEFKFRKLINDDKQIGQWFLRFSLMIELKIAGNVADLILVQQSLSPGKLIFQSDEVASDTGVQIRYCSRQMGQVLEG